MQSTDTSQTARIARLRQKIQGTETDAGVKTNADYSHFLQKKLGRTMFFRQTLDGVVTDMPCCTYSEVPNNIVATGYFTGEAAFYNADTSVGATLTAISEAAFIVKYDSFGNVTWATKIDGSDNDAGLGIAIDSQNNVLATGLFNATATFYNAVGAPTWPNLTTTGTAAFIVKYDSFGIVSWATKIDSSIDDIGYSIAVDSQNNVLATGLFNATATFYNAVGAPTWPNLTTTGTAAFIVKYDSSGTVSWATKIDSNNYDVGLGIAVDSQNNVLSTGLFTATATFYNAIGAPTWPALIATGLAAFIVKYDSFGTVSWATKIDSNNTDIGYSIAVDSQNNVLATGLFNATATFYNAVGAPTWPNLIATGLATFIVKYDSSGTVSWATKIDSPSDDEGRSIAIDSQNNVLATGLFTATATFYNAVGAPTWPNLTTTGTAAFIVKYDSSGTVSWATKIDNNNFATGYSIAVDSQNNVLAMGSFLVTVTFYNAIGAPTWPNITTTGTAAFIVKYDSSGIVTWATKIDTNADANYSIAVR